MAQRIINLDEVIPEGITVVMNGEDYALPGDIPVPMFLDMSNVMDKLQSGEAAEEDLERLYDLALELFQSEDPSIESLPIGPKRLGALIVQLYAGDEEPTPKAEPKPKRRAAGTANSSRKKPTKSPSSRS